ncbi:MAG TPA: hypothetical protein VE130_14875 [Nitrososphaeraceae archaeon]|nr:hypothetical protein [Nitrososphaeraceae archaeon]
MVPVNYDNKLGNGVREFWDGGILSNTPLRELIQSHEDYWKEKDASAMPALKVYIVDIWPHKGRAPLDHDGVVNRHYDLTYQEKTPHEEKIAYLIRDYIDLANKLIERSNIPPEVLNPLLDSHGESVHRNGEKRKYQELLQKVQIIDVIRVERDPDPNEISRKWCDYSVNTVTDMIKQGINDTLHKLMETEISKFNSKDPSNSLRRFIETVDTEKEDESLTEKLERVLDDITPSDLLIDLASNIKMSRHQI